MSRWMLQPYLNVSARLKTSSKLPTNFSPDGPTIAPDTLCSVESTNCQRTVVPTGIVQALPLVSAHPQSMMNWRFCTLIMAVLVAAQALPGVNAVPGGGATDPSSVTGGSLPGGNGGAASSTGVTGVDIAKRSSYSTHFAPSRAGLIPHK